MQRLPDPAHSQRSLWNKALARKEMISWLFLEASPSPARKLNHHKSGIERKVSLGHIMPIASGRTGAREGAASSDPPSNNGPRGPEIHVAVWGPFRKP